jgi:hypothetical protein
MPLTLCSEASGRSFSSLVLDLLYAPVLRPRAPPHVRYLRGASRNSAVSVSLSAPVASRKHRSQRPAGNHPRSSILPYQGKWCCRTGLNCRPLPYQGSALPLSYGSNWRGRQSVSGDAGSTAIGSGSTQGQKTPITSPKGNADSPWAHEQIRTSRPARAKIGRKAPGEPQAPEGTG